MEITEKEIMNALKLEKELIRKEFKGSKVIFISWKLIVYPKTSVVLLSFCYTIDGVECVHNIQL